MYSSEKLLNIYNEYLSQKREYWRLCNNVLYEMCSKHNRSENPDTIASKLLVIGRTYGAAIERGGKHGLSLNSFYYEKLDDNEVQLWKNIDSEIDALSKMDPNDDNTIIEAIRTHSSLLERIGYITGQNNRSLASKYLHFHLPDYFYIYDEQARKAIATLFKEASIKYVKSIEEYECDNDYRGFYLKANILKRMLSENNIMLCPRQLDDFLLWYYGTRSDS